MNPTTVDIKDLLESRGVGTFGGTSGWVITIGLDMPSPDTMITLYDVGGSPPNPAYLLDFPNFQLKVRGNEGDYLGTYNKIIEIRDILLGMKPQTINNTIYTGVWQLMDIASMQPDNGRPVMVTEWRVAREPASGENRLPL